MSIGWLGLNESGTVTAVEDKGELEYEAF